jgi:hypothetical protein
MLKKMSALSVIACLAMGCATARTSRLRVVDAFTGQPLSGVQAERLGFMVQPAMPGIIPVSVPFPLETSTSDSSGWVEFREQGADFALEKEGYEWTHITATLRGFRVRHSRDSPNLALQEDGSVQVPLKKRQSN